MRWWLYLIAIGFACNGGKHKRDASARIGSDGAVGNSVTDALAVSDAVSDGPMDPRLCIAKDEDPCNGIHCDGGNNSPHVNTFPANGLYSGQCNGDHVKLVAGSLNGPDCQGADLSFDADNHRLVGKKGSATCKHLKDATFQIGGRRDVATLTIKEVKKIKQNGHEYEAYKIMGPFGAVCNYDNALKTLESMGNSSAHKPLPCEWPANTSEPDSSGLDADFAIAIGGPIFSEVTGNPLDPTDTIPFFNIACADDALAKTTFWDLNQTVRKTSAALRMITARYFDTQSFTKEGLPLDFGRDGSGGGRDLEARWNANGDVTCIKRPRLLAFAKQHRINPKDFPACVMPPGCSTHQCKDEKSWLDALMQGSGSGAPIKSCDGGPGSDDVYSTFSGDSRRHAYLPSPSK